ncbi:hypothetical protein GOP47_0009086, partial [Adiantum capillus-veneris]
GVEVCRLCNISGQACHAVISEKGKYDHKIWSSYENGLKIKLKIMDFDGESYQHCTMTYKIGEVPFTSLHVCPWSFLPSQERENMVEFCLFPLPPTGIFYCFAKSLLKTSYFSMFCTIFLWGGILPFPLALNQKFLLPNRKLENRLFLHYFSRFWGNAATDGDGNAEHDGSGVANGVSDGEEEQTFSRLHLHHLLQCLDEYFKDVSAKFEWVKREGRVSYNMLWAFLAPSVEVCRLRNISGQACHAVISEKGKYDQKLDTI